MSGNRISLGFLSVSQVQDAIARDEATRISFGTRVMARLLAAKFDRMLAVGVPAPRAARSPCTRPD